jgi:hypothetical protein
MTLRETAENLSRSTSKLTEGQATESQSTTAAGAL